MAAEIKEIWESLVEAELVAPHRLMELQRQVPADAAQHADSLWTWLIASGIATRYHRELIERGRAGALRMGDFVIMQRSMTGPWSGVFQGRHRPSGQLAALDFFSENKQFRGGDWSAAANLARALTRADDRFLIPTFGPIVELHHSFVVSDWSENRWLPEKLAVKSRLPWENAVSIAVSLALAIDQLHQFNIVHGQIWPWTIELAGKSRARMRVTWCLDSHLTFVGPETLDEYIPPEHGEDQTLTPSADLFSLGCVLYRLITGRSPTAKCTSLAERKDTIRNGVAISAQKYGLPPELVLLMGDLLAFEPKDRPRSAQHVASALCECARLSLPQIISGSELPPTRSALRPAILGHDSIEHVALSVRQPAPIDAVGDLAVALADHNLKSATWRRSTTTNRWFVPITLMAGMAVFVGALFAGWMYLNSTPAPPLAGGPSVNGQTRFEIGDDTAPVRDVAGRGPTPAMLQTVVEDNGQLLWESPTQGPPIDLAAFPPGLRLVISVRAKAFLDDPQGELIVQAIGPELSSWADRILAQSGFDWAEMDLLQIGLYAGEGEVYTPLFQVVLNAPIAPDQLATRWNGEWLTYEPDHPESAAASLICRAGERDYLMWRDVQDEKVSSFVFGPPSLVSAAREGGPQRPLAGVWRQLADVSDSHRHVTVIFMASALFNEAGQNLMAGSWYNLNRRLRLAFGDTVRGGLLSVHLDQGNYVELIVNHQPDQTGVEVTQLLISELRAARDEAIETIADTPAHPYWNRVRMRFGNMLTDAVRQTRAGVERGHVVMNAWLPPAGIQNLLAANRVAFGMTGGEVALTETPREGQRSVPRTMVDLLAIPRSLLVTTNPDLNLLLQSIVDEVRADHPGLPFKFEIRLAGSDLLLEGITQNQRPGDFELQQQPLSEILTAIMVRANPDKSISGPADENCKLVWVLEPRTESEGGGERVLVTTRQAAKDRGLTLPPAFQVN